MKLEDIFQSNGIGVIATASADGNKVNAAVYAKPHIVDEKTLAWGMTDGRTFNNLQDNPNAQFLFVEKGGAFIGARIGLRLKEVKDSGELFDEVRAHTADVSGPAASQALTHIGYFEVTEIRPLI